MKEFKFTKETKDRIRSVLSNRTKAPGYSIESFISWVELFCQDMKIVEYDKNNSHSSISEDLIRGFSKTLQNLKDIERGEKWLTGRKKIPDRKSPDKEMER